MVEARERHSGQDSGNHKKEPGVDPKNLTNKEKTNVVDALRNEHHLRELLVCLGLARSSYFYHRRIAALPGKYEELQRRVIELFEESCRRYGYRRIHALLAREGTRVSEKIVRRIMLEKRTSTTSDICQHADKVAGVKETCSTAFWTGRLKERKGGAMIWLLW